MHELPKGISSLNLVSAAKVPLWIEIEESGQSVAVTTPHVTDQANVIFPRRYGWHWGRLDPGEAISIRRTENTDAVGKIRTAVHCGSEAISPRQIEWWRQAGEVSKQIENPAMPEKMSEVIQGARLLGSSAIDPKAQAIAQHLLAQALWVNGSNMDGADAFGQADKNWTAIGEKQRAYVAYVAKVEALRQAGMHDLVLTAVEAAKLKPGGTRYWQLRLDNSRCFTLRVLVRFDAADACYRGTLSGLRELDERAEYVETVQNYAGLQFARGNLEKSRQVLAEALATGEKINDPVVLGRVHYLAAGLAQRAGQPVVFFDHANAALLMFRKAGWRAWESRVWTDIATFYAKFELPAEAIDALSAAVQLMPADATAEMGTAMLTYAGLLKMQQRYFLEALWARVAEKQFSILNRPLEFDAARLLGADAELHLGALDEAEAKLASSSGKTTYAQERKIFRAELALKRNRTNEAKTEIDELKGLPATLSERIRIAELEAHYWHAVGENRRGDQTLLRIAEAIRRSAESAKDPIFRYMISRLLWKQQREGLQSILDRVWKTSSIGDLRASESDLDLAWTWLTLGDFPITTPAGTIGRHPVETERFDQSMAKELLASVPDAHDSEGRRALISLLAAASNGAALGTIDHSRQSLQAMQQRLGPDEAVLAYIEGTSHGAVLWVGRNDARLFAAADPDAVRSSTANLLDSLTSPESKDETLRRASLALSAALLDGIPRPAPRRLYVLNSEPMNRVPWSVLYWPGRQRRIVEDTSVGLLRVDGSAHPHDAEIPTDLQILTSAEGAGAALPALDNAETETEAIKAELGRRGVHVAAAQFSSRETLTHALQQRGKWVHIAAHGTARPEHLGHTGIWLTAQKKAEFVSWLDVLSTPVASDLIVLSACELGDSGKEMHGTLSFADAISIAGARNVVASMWRISDAASVLWSSSFYSSLASDENADPVEALRAAQLRMLSSKHFRHPFYWSGMQAIIHK